MRRWRVWNTNYRATSKDCRRLVRYTDLEKPWIVLSPVYCWVFATHAEALEYALQQTGRNAAGCGMSDQ